MKTKEQLNKQLAESIAFVDQTRNEFAGKGIVELMKRLGLDVQASDLPQYNWKANI